jgi:signal transduction histidine kinase
MVNAKKMTAPTKQQLRDLIAELREEISHLKNQLAENELLREKLAKNIKET